MLSYVPGETLAHRLDPRSKLCFQVGFAIAVFAVPSVDWLAGLYGLAAAVLIASRLSPIRVVRSYRVVLVVLTIAPIIAGLSLEAPWFRLEPARTSLFAVARVPPVLAVSAVYVHTTPIRGTRAAVERLVPGRASQLLGVGVSLVFRFFPLVVQDLRAIRTAMRSRVGTRRPLTDRARRLAVQGLDRTMARSDRLAIALRARCFSWNPTLPALQFGRSDYAVLALAALLASTPLLHLIA